ncbi:hypothetical protein ACX93W_06715 [Paenibacillus sp. CAU 1782]
MKKFFVFFTTLILSITVMVPFVQAHHWSYERTWSNVNSTWWNACTGLGTMNHTKTLWIDTVNGESLLFLFDHEVWVNTTSKIPYMYSVNIMKSLNYTDPGTNNNLGSIGDHQWGTNMEHSVLMGGDWTFTYGHSDINVWSAAYKNVNLKYDTAARIYVSECGGFGATFLGSISSTTDVVYNIPPKFTTNERIDKNVPTLQSEDIKRGIELKNEILTKYSTTISEQKKNGDSIFIDEAVDKWVERIAINMINSGHKISLDSNDIINAARKSVLRHDAILLLAEKYGVDYDKLNEFIEDQKRQALNSDTGRIVIDDVINGLGLKDINELFYEYDFDHHQQSYIWSNIQPEYEKKNPKMENEDPSDYRDRLLELFNSEINETM